MARIRSINPCAPVDEEVAQLSIFARYVWAYLPCHADREGRLKDSAFALKHAILPADNVDMEEVLSELTRAKFIVRYEVDGKRYIQIRRFLKHQTPHIRETPSLIPAPTGHETSTGEGSPKANLGSAEHDTGPSDPGPDLDPDQFRISSRGESARDPGTTGTEVPARGAPKPLPPSVRDPLKAHDLLGMLKVAIEREHSAQQRRFGLWAPGVARPTVLLDELLDTFPPEQRDDRLRAEIRARVDAFAKSDDDWLRKKGWSVLVFIERFASLGSGDSRAPPPKPRSSGQEYKPVPLLKFPNMKKPTPPTDNVPTPTAT